MEKGHFGGYTGNARHSRKEEMIHDRELIYDAKKQLHHADQDYKSDSPAHRALVGDQNKLPGHLKKAISDAPARMNADLKYDPVNDRADSPMSMYGKKEGSPAKNSGLGPKKAGSALYAAVFSEDVRGAYGGGSNVKNEFPGEGGGPPITPTTPTVPPATKTESFGIASGTSRGADRRERRLGKAERKASVSTGKTKARLERKADRIKRRQTIKGDGLQSKPAVKKSNNGKPKGSGGSGGSGGSSAKGGSGGSSGKNINTQNVNVYR